MLRIGVVGAGHLGKIHLRILSSIQEICLSGFFDTNPVTRQQVSEENGLDGFTGFTELLDASDALVVVSPTTTHYYYAALGMQAGKHLFIEKPLTHTIAEAMDLAERAALIPVKVQVGFVERFNPAYEAASPSIHRPLFIESHRLAMFQSRGTDVSVVMDLMIHDLDILLEVVGSPVERIDASGVSILSATADIANARISFQNGCVANLTASRFSMKQMRKMRIFQSDAYISLDFLEKKSQIIALSDEMPREGPFLELTIQDAQKKYIRITEPEILPSNAIEMELRHWIKSITYDEKVAVSLQDGIEALRLAHSIENIIAQNLSKTPSYSEYN